MLTWDRNGYVMGQKKLAKGKFDVPNYNQETVTMPLKRMVRIDVWHADGKIWGLSSNGTVNYAKDLYDCPTTL